MTRQNRILANLAKLPEVAYVKNTGAGRICYDTEAPVIAVKRGEYGYHPIHTTATADELNERRGVTPAMREAMLVGSMFGWHVPGADPDTYHDLKV